VANILCGGKLVVPGEATVRVLALDAGDGMPLRGLKVWLRWPDPQQEPPLDPITPGIEQMLLGIESAADDRGVVTFCGVPAGTPLELVILRSDDDGTIEGARFVRVDQWILGRGEVAARTIRVRPPR
jgi:hypothetical protein